MRPRGRPPTPRGVYSFEDASIDPPDRAVLDTSFVVEAVIDSQPAHVVCQDYFVRLALAGTTIVFNGLLEIELQEAAFQLGLKEDIRGTGSDIGATVVRDHERPGLPMLRSPHGRKRSAPSHTRSWT